MDVEEFIFQVYKDKPIYGAKRFKKECKDLYNYKPSSDLYARIVNYQIEKYGEMIALGREIKFVENVGSKSFKARERNKRTSYYAEKLRQLERRMQKWLV